MRYPDGSELTAAERVRVLIPKMKLLILPPAMRLRVLPYALSFHTQPER